MTEHFVSSHFFFAGTDDDGLGRLDSECTRFRLTSFESVFSFTVTMYLAFGFNTTLVPPALGVVYLFDVVHVFCSDCNSK